MKNLRKALLTLVGTATLLIGTTTFANVTGTVTLPDGTKPEKTFVNISKITDGLFSSVGEAYIDDSTIDYDVKNIKTLKQYVNIGQPAYKNTWGVKIKAEKNGIEYFAMVKAEDGKPFTAKLKKAYPIEFNITDCHGNRITNVNIDRPDYEKYIPTYTNKVEDHETIYLENYKLGKHTFTVSADGFKDKKVTVDVKSYRTKVNVVMESVDSKTVVGSIKLQDGTPVTKNMIAPLQKVEENISPIILNMDKNGQFKFVARKGNEYISAEIDSLIKLTDGNTYKATVNGGNRSNLYDNGMANIILSPVYQQVIKVVDEAGNNLTSKATVSIYLSETSNLEWKVEAKNGTDKIVKTDMLGAGTYKVVVKVDGYKPLETEMTVAKDKSFTEAVFTVVK